MEGERNECLEALGFILQLPQPDQVVDAMKRLFDVSVQHGAVGAQT
jgi:hypothetical protein